MSDSDSIKLVDSIEETIKLLTRTHNLVDTFHSDNQEQLIDNVANLIKCYKKIDGNRNVFGELKVPMDVLDHLDRQGKFTCFYRS